MSSIVVAAELQCGSVVEHHMNSRGDVLMNWFQNPSSY